MAATEKARDKLNEVLTATIDMQVEKEKAMSDIIKAVQTHGQLGNRELRLIVEQAQLSIDHFQNEVYKKLAALGNSLWKKAIQ